MRSQEMINKTIADIKELAKKLPEFDSKGNSYKKAVDAQIDALELKIDEEGIIKKYVDDGHDQFYMNKALLAYDWIIDSDLEDDCLQTNWQALIDKTDA